jgi:S-adenosylmethionine:tRNA ribosyltransferase-isomerase
MLKNATRCRPGEQLRLAGWQDGRAVLEANLQAGVWRLRLEPALPAQNLLERIGETPLPPYIRRDSSRPDAADALAYQTVYAAKPGAVAAPAAGLHFTPAVLEALARRGVESAHVTLHVGMGTFLPVKARRVQDHRMHAEWYELSAAAAEAVNRAKRLGRRVLAVGTTSVRVLETVWAQAACSPPRAGGGSALGPVQASSGWTDIFIYPPSDFRVVDGLLTNFHLPQSSLLMLVAALCSPGASGGIATILSAYREAIAQRYRFYSYGDAMLIV